MYKSLLWRFRIAAGVHDAEVNFTQDRGGNGKLHDWIFRLFREVL
jgi:hypothetical protein